MEIILINIGKNHEAWVESGIKNYLSRLVHYIKFNVIALNDTKSRLTNKSFQKDSEGNLILEQINKSDFVVLLDEKGKSFTSNDFASWIEKKMNTGVKRLVFVIGGPFGFSQKVYERANQLISLSSMTFTHDMAKLFFIEQCYRAMTIIRGESYHHD